MRRGVIGLIVLGMVAFAAAPAFAQLNGVKGQDVMGDRDRSGPDGFVQAPIPRTDSATGNAPGEGKTDRSADTGHRSVPDGGKALSKGADPGTPMETPKPTP